MIDVATTISRNDRCTGLCPLCNSKAGRHSIYTPLGYPNLSTIPNWSPNDAHGSWSLFLRTYRTASDTVSQKQDELGCNGPSSDYRCLNNCSYCEYYKRISAWSGFLASHAQSSVLRTRKRSTDVAGNQKITMATKSTRDPYFDPSYFQNDNYCRKHNRYKCEECYEQQTAPTALTTIIATNQDTNSFQAKKAEENFTKSVDFVKIGLDMDDTKMDSVKVKDLPGLVIKARDEITIGKMKKVLTKESGSTPGVLQTAWEWIKFKLS